METNNFWLLNSDFCRGRFFMLFMVRCRCRFFMPFSAGSAVRNGGLFFQFVREKLTNEIFDPTR